MTDRIHPGVQTAIDQINDQTREFNRSIQAYLKDPDVRAASRLSQALEGLMADPVVARSKPILDVCALIRDCFEQYDQSGELSEFARPAARHLHSLQSSKGGKAKAKLIGNPAWHKLAISFATEMLDKGKQPHQLVGLCQQNFDRSHGIRRSNGVIREVLQKAGLIEKKSRSTRHTKPIRR